MRKCLDFGLVRPAGPAVAADLTSEGRLVGTPNYMAPEQIEGRAADERSDLYSLGALAYFLLTGRPPFERDGALGTLLAHLREDPCPPRHWRPGLPADLEAVVLRCLVKAPAGRYASAAELDRALARCGDAGGWTSDDAAAWWHRAREEPGDRADAAREQRDTHG